MGREVAWIFGLVLRLGFGAHGLKSLLFLYGTWVPGPGS